MDNQQVSQTLQDIFKRLIACYGPQYWWPAGEPFEVMVGAILTQQTTWLNVEKATSNLKEAKALSPEALRRLDLPEVARLIRPSGYYNAKALKLKSLAHWLGEYYDDQLDKLSSSSTAELRRQLLSVHGIGPETADSIILYATGKPIFVIDAYTRRIFSRIGLAPNGNSYAIYQAFFMDNLTADAGLFNEYHALLVRLGKDACRKKPHCLKCCLGSICRFNEANSYKPLAQAVNSHKNTHRYG